MDTPEQAALKEAEIALSELCENRTWFDQDIHPEDRAMLKKALRKVRSAIKGRHL